MSLKLGNVLIAGAIPAPSGALIFKGSCLQSALPTSGQQRGDYWKLTDSSGIYQGQCAIWNAINWDYSSASVSVDTSLSDTSINPVQNKVINTALNQKENKLPEYVSGKYLKTINDGTTLKLSWEDANVSLQLFYDGIYPVNSTIFGFQAPGIPNGVTATWTDVSASYEGRYFKISSTDAAGTSQSESLPLPSISMTSNGDHNHDRGTMNITGLLRTAPSADSNVGDTMAIKHASGAFYNAGAAGDGTQRLYDINANYSRDGNVSTIGFNAASSWSGVTSTGGSHSHDVTVSGTPYSSGAAVKPLTTTIKVWKRTA